MSNNLLKPVSTRSALLTTLIAADEPSLTARELVAVGSYLGIAEPTVRVALSRMVAGGDLVRVEAGYRLSDRLLERQRRQDQAVHPCTRGWRGQWEVVVVTAVGRPAAERAELRAELTGLRLAELREGVWTRPANLRIDWPTAVDDVATRFAGKPVDAAAALAAELWDLGGWADTARALLDATRTSDNVLRFTACATSGRHLLADPVLPPELLPAEWPGDALRESHLESRHWLSRLRKDLAA